MRVVREVNLFEDVEVLRRVGYLSLAILVAGILAIALALVIGFPVERIGWGWAAATALACVISFVSHELVHGLLFRLMGGRGTRVRFGASRGMLYTTAPDLVLPTHRFMAVLLAPTFVVSAVAIACGVLWEVPLAAAIVVVVHLSGCAGDIVFAHIVLAEHATSVSDSETGVVLYG